MRKYVHSNEGLGGKNGFVGVKQGIRGDLTVGGEAALSMMWRRESKNSNDVFVFVFCPSTMQHIEKGEEGEQKSRILNDRVQMKYTVQHK